jgi:hypothetical protein
MLPRDKRPAVLLRSASALSPLILLVALTSCSTPKKQVLGRWQHKTETLEFFQDGKVAIASAGNPNMTGTWLVLDDGRLKVEIGMLGMALTLTGNVDGETLVLVRPPHDTARYERIR